MQQLQSRIRSSLYAGHDQFFRSRLLTQTPEQVATSLERMEKEAKKIKSEMLRMCWSMRGGITYNEAMQLSYQDRELIGGIIKENLDTTKKTGLNYF